MKLQSIIFGNTRTGKSRKLADMAISSLNKGHRVIYLGKSESEIETLVNRAARILPPGQAPIVIPTDQVPMVLDGNGGVKLKIEDVPAIFASINMVDYDPLEHQRLVQFLMGVVQSAPGGDASWDVYLDECLTWCGANVQDLLIAGNITIVYQFMTHLDYCLGKERANEFVRQFATISVFKCDDPRSLQMAANTLPENADKEQILNSIPTLGMGEHVSPAMM